MGDDNPEHITAREFDERMKALTAAMVDGFHGVHERVSEVKDELKAMNSKVASQQAAIGDLRERAVVQGVRIDGHQHKLDKIDTGFRHARKDDPPPPPAESITVKVTPKIWAALAAVGGAVLVMLLEWVKQRVAQP